MLHVPASFGLSVGGGEVGGDGCVQRHRQRRGAVEDRAFRQRCELRRR